MKHAYSTELDITARSRTVVEKKLADRLILKTFSGLEKVLMNHAG